MILIPIILIIIAYQLISLFGTYGGPISKFDEELYSNLDTNILSISEYEDTLHLPYGLGRGTRIIKVPFHFYGRYRIDNVGIVKRKSKLDKEIEEHFISVTERSNQARLKNSKRFKKNKD